MMRNMNKLKSEKHDYLIKQPDFIEIIKDKKKIAMFENSKYNPIFSVLQEGALTLPEITEKYNEIAKKPKKQITISLYLKELEEEGLIIKSGQRAIIGKDADKKIYSRTLYARSAKLFFPAVLSEEYWKTDRRVELINNINDLFALYLKQPKSSFDCLSELIYKIYVEGRLEIAKFFEESSEAVIEIVGDKSFQELEIVLQVLNFLLVILEPQTLEKKFRECYKKSKSV